MAANLRIIVAVCYFFLGFTKLSNVLGVWIDWESVFKDFAGIFQLEPPGYSPDADSYMKVVGLSECVSAGAILWGGHGRLLAYRYLTGLMGGMVVCCWLLGHFYHTIWPCVGFVIAYSMWGVDREN